MCLLVSMGTRGAAGVQDNQVELSPSGPMRQTSPYLSAEKAWIYFPMELTVLSMRNVSNWFVLFGFLFSII